MIEIIFGSLGASKTWTGTERIIDRLKQGCKVVTNIELREGGIKEVCGDEAWDRVKILTTREEIFEFYKYVETGEEVHNLVVIDEVHKYWDAKDTQKNNPKGDYRDILDWLDMSRRFRNDVILISQKPGKIDSRIRGCAEVYTKRRDLRRVPILNMFWRGFYEVNYDEDCKTKISWRFCRIDQRIGKCYNTYSVVGNKPRGSGEVAQNVGNHSTTVKRTNWKVWLILGLFLFAIWKASSFYKELVDRGKAAPEAEAKASPQVITRVETPALLSRAAAEPPQDDRSAAEKFLAEAPYLRVSVYAGREVWSGPLPLREGGRIGRWDVLMLQDGEVWLRWYPTGDTRRLRLISARDEPDAPVFDYDRPRTTTNQYNGNNTSSGGPADGNGGPALSVGPRPSPRHPGAKNEPGLVGGITGEIAPQ